MLTLHKPEGYPSLAPYLVVAKVSSSASMIGIASTAEADPIPPRG